ncbi:MAG: hypothetical protein PHH48_07890, partial [Eubacteriales bacterium]|nr:hypothetical protein [Eubacteriales bacterium]
NLERRIWMDDNLSNTMDKIQHMLQDEKTLENIKTLIGALANNSSEPSPAEKQPTNMKENDMKGPVPVKEMPPILAGNSKTEIAEQMNTIVKIKNIYDRIANDDDPRLNLLTALRPYLNNKRQSNLESAIKVVQLSKLTTIANEFDDD